MLENTRWRAERHPKSQYILRGTFYGIPIPRSNFHLYSCVSYFGLIQPLSPTSLDYVGVGKTISKKIFFKSSNKDEESLPLRISRNFDLTPALNISSNFPLSTGNPSFLLVPPILSTLCCCSRASCSTSVMPSKKLVSLERCLTQSLEVLPQSQIYSV